MPYSSSVQYAVVMSVVWIVAAVLTFRGLPQALEGAFQDGVSPSNDALAK